MKFLFDIRDLRKLILLHCCLGKDSTGLLASVVALYPNLEGLSLNCCYPLTSDVYSHISRLKKLSELDLSGNEVNYVYIKILEIHVCIREYMQENNPVSALYLFRQEGNLLLFLDMLHNISFIFHKMEFLDFIIFCSTNTFFVQHMRKFKYSLWQDKVEPFSAAEDIIPFQKKIADSCMN